MTTFITIYLLLGFAFAMTHVFQCDDCTMTLVANVSFVMQIIINTFGWPVEFYKRFVERKKFIAEITERVHRDLTKGGDAFLVRQEPNESIKDFHARINRILQEKQNATS